eukprot:5913048-Prymnesium_polylepis.1
MARKLSSELLRRATSLSLHRGERVRAEQRQRELRDLAPLREATVQAPAVADARQRWRDHCRCGRCRYSCDDDDNVHHKAPRRAAFTVMRGERRDPPSNEVRVDGPARGEGQQ